MDPVECVFGDWHFDITDQPVAVFRPGHIFPLAWNGWQVSEVSPADGLADTVPYIALAAHWARTHPEQLAVLVGDVELQSM